MARRLHKNPSPEEQFRELVMDPDPAAMQVAEDVVTGNGLTLLALGEEQARLQRPPWRQEDPQHVMIKASGWFNLSRDASTCIGWQIYHPMNGFEIEVIYRLHGISHDANENDANENGYTGAIGHTTYYKTLALAKRAAAADTWAVARRLKQFQSYPEGNVGRQELYAELVEALHAKDVTAPAVYGHRRRPKKRERGNRRNPGELPTVQAEYEALIVQGMARVLWVHAYDARSRAIGDIGALVPPSIPHAALSAARALAGVIVKNEQVGSLVDLFAIAVEIDTGEPLEYQPLEPLKTFTVRSPEGVRKYQATDQAHAREQHLDAFPDDMTQALAIREVTTRPEPEYFTEFANRFVEGIRRDMVTGVSAETWEILDAGDTPENEWYWEAWEELLRDAVITDADGQVWSVTQSENGIFLIPDGMEWSDEDDWYVWPEAAADDELPLAEEFGQALAHMCLDDSQSWFEGHKQRSESGNMEWAPELPGAEISYDGEQLTWRIVHGSPAGPDTRGKEFIERRVRITFESVTPGDEDDDDIENGWEDEEGVLIESDEDETIAEATAKLIRDNGSVEASSSSFHAGVWYTQIDGSENYETGERRTLSFHLYGYTPEEEREVFEDLTRRRR